jgi:hypothetical protein
MKVEFVNAKIPAVCDKLNCIDKNGLGLVCAHINIFIKFVTTRLRKKL